MKKLFTLLTVALCATFSMQAQLADGSIAPNFTTTDINGNEYTLYDILDQGKSVVLDISATWCGPCWNYHQGHALEDLYTQYGPDGTDEVMVLWVEGDASTAENCITGDCGSSTIGDWTAGTSYPLIDDASIADAYQIGYYPTVYHICPNRLVTEIGQASTATLYAAGGNCAQAAGVNNAGILSYDGFSGTICTDTDITPEVTVQNLGTENMTSATFEVRVDGNVMETVEWTGDLATFNTMEMEFATVSIAPGAMLEVATTNVNGTSDDDTSNDMVMADFPSPATTDQVELTMELQMDQYAYEIYWQVTNSAGMMIAEGGNLDVGINGGGDQDATAGGQGAYQSASATETITVPADVNDCYTFTLVDDWGDGIAYQTTGTFFRVSDAAGNVLIDTNMDGNQFASYDDLVRTDVISSTRDLETVSGLNVFPNPVQDQLTVSFGLSEAARLEVGVFNALGQQVATVANQNFAAGTQNLRFETSNLTNGIYYLQLTDGERRLTKKFTVLGK